MKTFSFGPKDTTPLTNSPGSHCDALVVKTAFTPRSFVSDGTWRALAGALLKSKAIAMLGPSTRGRMFMGKTKWEQAGSLSGRGNRVAQTRQVEMSAHGIGRFSQIPRADALPGDRRNIDPP